jgi:hypothetical protein
VAQAMNEKSDPLREDHLDILRVVTSLPHRQREASS